MFFLSTIVFCSTILLLLMDLVHAFFFSFLFWRNYNIGLSSLPCVCNWSLKFEVSTIGLSSFKTELY